MWYCGRNDTFLFSRIFQRGKTETKLHFLSSQEVKCNAVGNLVRLPLDGQVQIVMTHEELETLHSRMLPRPSPTTGTQK
jgi:hypothetical protein